MELNLPIYDQVLKCKSLLIAGMGGGFDVFCGLPIYFELKRRGLNVHLANFSFSEITTAEFGIRLSPILVGVTAEADRLYPYFPEMYLSQWFKEKRGEEVPIWSFQKTGAKPLLDNYRLLVDRLNLDGILLIDGGVDSLARGDEAAMGTPIEDATSLYAVNELNEIPTRLIACVGFGAEQDMAYANFLENIANLTRSGGLLGVCGLTPQMEAYQAYEEAVLYTQAKPIQDPSVINSSIISAVRGEYGDYHLTTKTSGSTLAISPLMSLYWFFSLEAVVNANKFLPSLNDTYSFQQAVHKMLEGIRPYKKRSANKFLF